MANKNNGILGALVRVLVTASGDTLGLLTDAVQKMEAKKNGQKWRDRIAACLYKRMDHEGGSSSSDSFVEAIISVKVPALKAFVARDHIKTIEDGGIFVDISGDFSTHYLRGNGVVNRESKESSQVQFGRTRGSSFWPEILGVLMRAGHESVTLSQLFYLAQNQADGSSGFLRTGDSDEHNNFFIYDQFGSLQVVRLVWRNKDYFSPPIEKAGWFISMESLCNKEENSEGISILYEPIKD